MRGDGGGETWNWIITVPLKQVIAWKHGCYIPREVKTIRWALFYTIKESTPTLLRQAYITANGASQMTSAAKRWSSNLVRKVHTNYFVSIDVHIAIIFAATSHLHAFVHMYIRPFGTFNSGNTHRKEMKSVKWVAPPHGYHRYCLSFWSTKGAIPRSPRTSKTWLGLQKLASSFEAPELLFHFDKLTYTC